MGPDWSERLVLQGPIGFIGPRRGAFRGCALLEAADEGEKIGTFGGAFDQRMEVVRHKAPSVKQEMR